MPPKIMEIVGTLKKVAWHDPKSEYVILKIDRGKVDDGHESQVAAKGEYAIDQLDVGLDYRFYGKWGKPNNYKGKIEGQFYFHSLIIREPHTRAGIVTYLTKAGKGNGLGRATASKLYQAYRDDAVRIMREEPERALDRFPSLKRANLQAIQHILNIQAAIEGTTIDLTGLFDGRGFPRTTIPLVVQDYGAESSRVVRRSPYVLMNYPRCGFRKTDAMYLDLGLDPRAMKRQALAAWYACASDSNGNTWLPRKFVEGQISKFIGSTEVNTESAINLAQRLGKINENSTGALSLIRSRGWDGEVSTVGSMEWCGESKRTAAEGRLADSIAMRMNDPGVEWPSVDKIEKITDHQRSALRQATSNGSVAILCGGPGTGKTFTTAEYVKVLAKEFGSHSILIGAPTGKAAVRITEAMREARVPMRARTWHSHLKILKSARGGWSFEQNSQNPFDAKVVIGDEMSMVDTSLGASIFNALAPGTLFLIVGDTNQLPPVSHGRPLYDMIKAGVPCGELTEIKRSSGGINEACHAIREGKPWGEGDNIKFVRGGTEAAQKSGMLKCISRVRSLGSDPVWDCQVLTAVNRKSELSRKELNALLQSELNPGRVIQGQPFRLNDKVVNTKNGFFPDASMHYSGEAPCDIDDVSTNDDGDIYCANGEVGKVIKVEPKFFDCELYSPLRRIRVPRAQSSDSDDEPKAEDKEDTGTGCSFDLGYALSVHKSQGSEWKYIIVMLDTYAGAKRICSREWIYTGISRSKQMCLLVGEPKTAKGFCSRQAIGDRKTFLTERIRMQLTDIELSDM